MEYRPVVPAGMMPTGLHQDYHAAIPDLSPPRSQGSSTGGASSIGDYAPRMYTPPTPPTPHEDEKVNENMNNRTGILIHVARISESPAFADDTCCSDPSEFTLRSALTQPRLPNLFASAAEWQRGIWGGITFSH